MTSTNIPVSTSLPSRRLFKLLYKFQQMLQKGLWVWGEAIQKLRQKGSYEERIFKTMLHELGRSLISLLHTTITFMYKKDNEDPSWSTSFKTRRTQKTSSAVWKCLKDFYFVVFGTGQRETRPVWNNAQRINHQNKFVPSAVLTRSGRVPVSAAKKSSPRAAVSTSPTRPVNTATPKKSVNLSNSRRNTFHKVNGVNTVGQTAVSAVEGNGVSAVKASASCAHDREQRPSLLTIKILMEVCAHLVESTRGGKDTDEIDKDDTTDDTAGEKPVQKPASGDQQTLKNNLSGKTTRASSTNSFNTVSTPVNVVGAPRTYNDVGPSFADFNNMEPSTAVSLIPSARVHYFHPKDQIIGDPRSAVQTMGMIKKSTREHAMISYIQKQRRTNHKDFQNCLFACFLSQQEPTKIAQALDDESWVEAMQAELLQFKI
ncbi:hypothetical protein Tco_0411809 [Tanacetum coccineum]